MKKSAQSTQSAGVIFTTKTIPDKEILIPSEKYFLVIFATLKIRL
jgi:hypothetical protein